MNYKKSLHRNLNCSKINNSKGIYKYNHHENNNHLENNNHDNHNNYNYQKKINDDNEIEFYKNLDRYFREIEPDNPIKIYFHKFIKVIETNQNNFLVLENIFYKFTNPIELEYNLYEPYQINKPYISRNSFRLDFLDHIEKILKLYFESDNNGKIIIAIIDRLVMLYKTIQNNKIWDYLDLNESKPKLLIIFETENNNGNYLKILIKLSSFKNAKFKTLESQENNNQNKSKKIMLIKGIKILICHLINFYYMKFFLYD